MKTFFIVIIIIFTIVMYFSYMGVLPKFYNFGAEDTAEREKKISEAEKLRIEQQHKLEDQKIKQRRLVEDRQRKLRDHRNRY
jgi:hypothetical protein